MRDDPTSLTARAEALAATERRLKQSVAKLSDPARWKALAGVRLFEENVAGQTDRFESRIKRMRSAYLPKASKAVGASVKATRGELEQLSALRECISGTMDDAQAAADDELGDVCRAFTKAAKRRRHDKRSRLASAGLKRRAPWS